MAQLIMLVGLPGSGKSVYASTLSKTNPNIVVLSSDLLRQELYGDINDQSHNVELFIELHNRIKNNLRNGIDVIYDATNINRKKRIAFISELKSIPCEKIAILIATPYEECIKNNIKRERTVPAYIIYNMYKNFQIPSKYEGFDYIIIHNNYKSYYGTSKHFYKCTKKFNQDNSHHTLTLGKHCKKAYLYLHKNLSKDKNNYYNILFAVMLHDCGKPECKSYIDSKGNTTKDAHYYNHNYIGAYKSLFYQKNILLDDIYISLLIEYHMNPYTNWKKYEKSLQKDTKLFGINFITDVMLIHQADVYAH